MLATSRALGVARLLVAAWCLVAAVCAQGQASPPRIALVIGNADYKSAPLKNPVNDARAVSRALKELGFEVLLKENVSQQGFVAALREFGTLLKSPEATGLFYYAGHGMQVKNANYLIPVDAAIEGEDEIRYLALDANQVLDKMEQAGNRLNIVILDACRDNPFARSFRSKQNGLAQMDAPSGVLIAFATAPGAVAYDGEGVNGVYTKHLLRNLGIPGLPVELVLKRVREGVSNETGGKQIPWESSSLLGDFYFKSAAVQSSVPAAPDATTVEIAFWNSVKDSGIASEYRAYLDRYPNGRFALLARNRLNEALAPAAKKPAATPTQVALAQPSTAAAGIQRSAINVGDSWTYNLMQGTKRKLDTVTATVTAVRDGIVEEQLTREQARFSAKRSFAAGFDPQQPLQETQLPGMFFLPEFSPYVSDTGLPAPGKDLGQIEARVSTDASADANFKTVTKFSVRSVRQERIKLPAGDFDTVRVELVSVPLGPPAYGQLRFVYWYSPDVPRVVKVLRQRLSADMPETGSDSFELASYRRAQ